MALIISIVVACTGMWSPHRWGMYFDVLRQFAPITFYGRVVDDNGVPLAGTKVHVEIWKPNFLFILGDDHLHRKEYVDLPTDADGRFEVTRESGLAVRVSKLELAGYTFKPRMKNGGWDTTFYYAGPGASAGNAHVPNRNDPVLFEMQKR